MQENSEDITKLTEENDESENITPKSEESHFDDENKNVYGETQRMICENLKENLKLIKSGQKSTNESNLLYLR